MFITPKHSSIKILGTAILVSLFQVIQSSCAFGQSSPQAYLDDALNTIQSRALRRSNVDWNAVRSKSLSLAGNASNPADTYPAIRYALAQLQDNHSFLVNPNGSVERNPYVSNTTFSMPKPGTRAKGSHLVSSPRGAIGYIVVSAHNANDDSVSFAKTIRTIIDNFRAKHAVGWIIDLRDNSGGTMWPMLVGVGPINTAGVQGSFNYGNISVPWYYERGEAGVENNNVKHANFKVSDRISDFGDSSPLAVLINGGTASSGEALAISLRGRPHTRFFGTHTAGLSTSNETIKLSDGASLYLTTSVEADRNHKLYLNGLDPDEIIKYVNIPLGTDTEPAIQSAIRWLSSLN